jgi:hypothetical protein
VSKFRENRNLWTYCEFNYLYANLWTFKDPKRIPRRSEKIHDDVQLLFLVSNISRKSKIFGDANSNIFTRIFRHPTVHLDLKELLELKEFKDLDLLEHSKRSKDPKIPSDTR